MKYSPNRTEKRTGGNIRPPQPVFAAPVMLLLCVAGAFSLMPAAGCGQPQGIDPRVKGEIEDTLEEFYESLGKQDADDLADFIYGRLEDEFEDAAKEGSLAQFLEPYTGIEFDELDDLDIEGRDAEAKVTLKRGDRQYEQDLELELDEDIWKISRLGKLRAAGSERAEEAVRRAAQAVLTAMKNDDPETLRAIAEANYIEGDLSGYFNTIEQLGENTEERAQWSSSWGTLNWEFEKVEPFEPSPEAGIVVASVTRESSTVKWQLTFLLVDGEWKWSGIMPVEEEPEGAAAEQPQGEQRGELRQGECTNAAAVEIGGTIAGSLSGADKIYYKFEVPGLAPYSIYASGEADTIGILLDSTCTEIEENDDDGPGSNFLLVRYLEEGTYYVAVRGFTVDARGEFTLNVVEGELDDFPDNAAEEMPSGS